MFKKIISLFLIIAIVVSIVVVPVSAAFSPREPDIYDGEALDALDSYLERQFVVNLPIVDFVNGAWDAIDGCFQVTALGAARSLEILKQWRDRWNARINSDSYWGMVASWIVTTAFNPVPEAVVAFDSDLGVYRLKEKYSGLWLVNSSGYFPYYRPETADDTTGTEKIRTGQWRLKSEVGNQNAFWHAISYTELSLLAEQWFDDNPSTWISTENGYSSLVRRDREDLLTYILCDEKGYPYYMPKDKETAVTTPNNYYQDTTNQYIDDNSVHVNVQDGGSALVGSPVDVNNGIINVGGQVQYIDQLIYDASTQTYYVDAHDEYVYDVTLNQYVTNNYTYEIQYHIDHTSITYIGQTEEYDERYEMYFQLPDGRSSADLTAEDLEQLSTVFVDVVQYARSADDLSLRGLYHFDGNTEDSSYWSYCTAFDWASGASLTYMDEGTFNGSLYLDETEHDFTITLPSATDLSSDFTIQFRYYQSHTTAPVADSYIQLGSDAVLQFTGSQYLLGSGDALCDTSIGSWNEICIMKSAGTIYYYINGVCCGEVEDSLSHANTITFYFGDQQQTYKKLDELRISRGAIYTPGADYTPTSVPFDTNLTLILPDGDVPIADEIPVIVPGGGNLLADIGLDDWTDFESVLASINSAFAVTDNYLYRDSGLNIYGHGFQLTASEDCTQLSFSGSFSLADGKIGISSVKQVQNALFLPFRYGNGARYPSWVDDGSSSYCLSVVYPDGAFSYVVFCPGSSSFAVYGDSRIAFVRSEPSYTNPATSTTYRTAGIAFYPTEGSVDIAYMELVKGDTPAFTIDYEQAVYSSGELKDSPVLAVRTNRPISGYQIGGVRPSYPKTGLVYAMVENSRIISLQQYTGYAWEQVDGRIWTGERWIPYSSFDVFTLKDFYDVIGGGSDPDFEYIYTETGFWAWLQRQWIQLMEKLDQILAAILELAGIEPGSGCEHVYTSEIQREATCAAPGHMLYTCDLCGHKTMELIDPIGHDWVVKEHVDDVLDEEGNVVEEGYDIVVCSVCNLETKDYGDGPIESDLFDAIGDLLSKGVDFLLEKLTQLTDSLTSIVDTFNSYVDRVQGMTGEYGNFFGQFIVLLPEDLQTLLWFTLIAGIVGLVWLAWMK